MLSAHLEEYTTAEEARHNPRDPADASFGLCAVDIDAMTAATKGIATVRYWPTSGAIGHAHVQILGCTDLAVCAEIAAIAVVIHRPAAPRD
jgi:hypothetical protein